MYTQSYSRVYTNNVIFTLGLLHFTPSSKRKHQFSLIKYDEVSLKTSLLIIHYIQLNNSIAWSYTCYHIKQYISEVLYKHSYTLQNRTRKIHVQNNKTLNYTKHKQIDILSHSTQTSRVTEWRLKKISAYTIRFFNSSGGKLVLLENQSPTHEMAILSILSFP